MAYEEILKLNLEYSQIESLLSEKKMEVAQIEKDLSDKRRQIESEVFNLMVEIIKNFTP